jgi:transposase
MARSKIHHVSQALVVQTEISARCGVGVRSVQRVLTEPEPRPEDIARGRVGSGRQGRPPEADDAMVERIRLLLESEPTLPATKVLRLAREWVFRGGRRQTAALVKKRRPRPRAEPVVCFDGLPGEYAQFYFGEGVMDFTATGKQRVKFFGGRLKFSRFMHVELCPTRRPRRSLLAYLVEFGGSPKEWVFDNPRTVRISPIGAEPVVLHHYLRQVVAECRVIPTLCARRSGNQKGSVERLVGLFKNSFLLVRRFRDFAELRAQLAEMLHEVNHVRPCDATDPGRVARRRGGALGAPPRAQLAGRVGDHGDGDRDAGGHGRVPRHVALRDGAVTRRASDVARARAFNRESRGQRAVRARPR